MKFSILSTRYLPLTALRLALPGLSEECRRPCSGQVCDIRYNPEPGYSEQKDNVTSIGIYAFGDCPSLTSIKLPYGITDIKEGTFNVCRSLNSITIPNSVTNSYSEQKQKLPAIAFWSQYNKCVSDCCQIRHCRCLLHCLEL